MKRIQTLFLIGGWALVIFGIAACAQISGGAARQQAERVAAIARSVREVSATVSETKEELAALTERANAVERRVADLRAASDQLLARTAAIPDPPPGQVALRLRFQYLPQPLPGEGIQAYEPAPEANSLWAMASLSAGQPLPVGKPLPQNTLFLKPGEGRLVTLAYQNPTGEEVGFLVEPHQEWPGSLAQYVWPTCLCMSFVYTAPAKGAWYRVIRLTVSPDIPPGSKVDVLWLVHTDPAVFPAAPEAMAKPTPTPAAERANVIQLGETLAAQQGCLTCHSTDGSPRVGPTWLGLYGREETLADGTKVLVDEDYLYESIVNPNAKIVKGFPPNVMPQDYGQKLSDEEIRAIIEFIKSLGQANP